MWNNGTERELRPPAVAGQFYPRQPDDLRRAIVEAFTSPLGPGTVPVVQAGPRRLVGIVAPHAGYPYSAQGAAWAFAETARDGRPGAVVLLGVNHRGVGAPLALSTAQGWQTPLGVAPVDGALAKRLLALDPAVMPDERAHIAEHSLEVQVPFVQFLFGDVPILPIALGQASAEAVLNLGRVLASLAAETDLLVVASTDFSHYIPQEAARARDRQALDRIAAVDALGLMEVVRQQQITMCGVLPVATLLVMAWDLGVRAGTILHYHTSGDITGDTQEVVGYGAAALFR